MAFRGHLLVVLTLAATALPVQGQERTPDASARPRFSLPYAPGSEFLVASGYLEFPTHEGLYAIDWLMPEETPVHAAQGGVVVEAIDAFSESGLTDEMRDKGNRVVIQHDDGSHALYLHLAHRGVQVKVGQRVRKGQQIALSGNTGFSSTPHLHFMVYRLRAGRVESFPVLYESGAAEPFEIVRGAKYRAPGGTPSEDEGPLKGVQGTGELASIRPKLVALVKQAPTAKQGAIDLKPGLLDNREAYRKLYREVFARSQRGDKSAMKEIQDYLGGMDLQTQPDIARLLVDPSSAVTANEAMLVWWQLFSLP